MATLQYTGVFALLMAEIFVFILLILPMPTRWKRAMITWSSRSPVAQRVLYGVRIAFGFVFLLFADAIMRLRKVQQAKDSTRLVDEHTLCQHKVQQFYAQRNTYLTGITMFLGLILISTHSLIAQLVENPNASAAPRLVSSGPGSSKAQCMSTETIIPTNSTLRTMRWLPTKNTEADPLGSAVSKSATNNFADVQNSGSSPHSLSGFKFGWLTKVIIPFMHQMGYITTLAKKS
ncbi:Endoplasmic reticulum transmembrane protein 3 [Coemansia brasiliensis]|uniref:Endoplasmic reticulum transmembrane protein n=1 Tax=Coemansia brasiliensis TaxID=2650707 RepID=A0A9W8M0H5_9FUNG|nr:Endoplasmic reticulum transmembrane protein 3 [Coemansia brasiliensis]